MSTPPSSAAPPAPLAPPGADPPSRPPSPPGPPPDPLLSVVADLTGLAADLPGHGGGLSDADLEVGLAGVERLARLVAAVQLALLAELARRGGRSGPDGSWDETRLAVGEVSDVADDTVAAITGSTAGQAGRRCGLAARLVTDLARLAPPLAAGTISEATAAAIAERTEDAPAEVVEAVLDHLLAVRRGTDRPRVEVLDRHDLAAACRRVRDRVEPGWRLRRAQVVRATRPDVRSWAGGADEPGVGYLQACLPSESAMVLMGAVRTRAAELQRDQPGLRIGAARAQALLDLTLRGVEVTAHVALGVPVVQPPVRAALVPAHGDETSGSAFVPAHGDESWVSGVEVRGIGWIPPDVVAQVLARCDADVSRVLLGSETGAVLETSTRTYRPTPAMRRLVQLRDGRCRMWGCNRAAIHGDLDHAVPWPAGDTSGTNLATLCRHHHRLKHHPAWTYDLADDGTASWTSPGGTRRLTFPESWPTTTGPADAREASGAVDEHPAPEESLAQPA